MPLSARQSVEIFHLTFLRALVAKGEDKALIALKGGCNLRFYFGSVRYSEDVDFDVVVIAKDTLKNKVERLLRSPLLASPLRSRGIEITESSATKQTETTQRWKVGLRVALPGAQRQWLPAAIERAMGLSFDEYRSHVVAYLEPEQIALYEDASDWDAMQDAVVSRLEALQ